MIVLICFASLIALSYGQQTGGLPATQGGLLAGQGGTGLDMFAAASQPQQSSFPSAAAMTGQAGSLLASTLGQPSAFGAGQTPGQFGQFTNPSSAFGGMGRMQPRRRTSSLQDMMMPLALMGGAGDQMRRFMLFQMLRGGGGAMGKSGAMGGLLPLLMMRSGNDAMRKMFMFSMLGSKSVNPMTRMLLISAMNGGGEMNSMLPMLMMMNRQGGGSGQLPLPALAMLMNGNA